MVRSGVTPVRRAFSAVWWLVPAVSLVVLAGVVAAVAFSDDDAHAPAGSKSNGPWTESDHGVSLTVTPVWADDGDLRLDMTVANGTDGYVGWAAVAHIQFASSTFACRMASDSDSVGTWCSRSEEITLPLIERSAAPRSEGPRETVLIDQAAPGTYVVERRVEGATLRVEFATPARA
jgi:hypothetical protein